MTGTGLAILIVVVVAVLVAVGLAMMLQRRRLRPLAAEAKSRYGQSWKAIEGRFIEEPANAVQEADQLAVSMLRERGATIDDGKQLPRDLLQAREIARTNEGQSGTEGLRKAMLHYRRIFEDALGESMQNLPPTSAREVA